MDQSSQYKKQKFSDQGDGAKSLIIASKLIESGDSAHLREMLTNGELSDINMSDGSGKGLLILASEILVVSEFCWIILTHQSPS